MNPFPANPQMNPFPANPQAGVVARTSRLRKDDYEFETSLGYIAGLYLKKEGRRMLGGGSVGSACHTSTRTWVQTPVPLWKSGHGGVYLYLQG